MNNGLYHSVNGYLTLKGGNAIIYNPYQTCIAFPHLFVCVSSRNHQNWDRMFGSNVYASAFFAYLVATLMVLEALPDNTHLMFSISWTLCVCCVRLTFLEICNMVARFLYQFHPARLRELMSNRSAEPSNSTSIHIHEALPANTHLMFSISWTLSVCCVRVSILEICNIIFHISSRLLISSLPGSAANAHAESLSRA